MTSACYQRPSRITDVGSRPEEGLRKPRPPSIDAWFFEAFALFVNRSKDSARAVRRVGCTSPGHVSNFLVDAELRRAEARGDA
jgi:hypothetical protein